MNAPTLFEADPLRLDTKSKAAAVGKPYAPAVLGLDLSLSCTGVAGNTGGGWTTTLTPPKGLRDVARLDWIRGEIVDKHLQGIQLVAIEGPSYGNQGAGRQAGHHERAGLWWIVVRALWRRGIPYAVISPAGRAKYAAGTGNAKKDTVLLEVAKRFPFFRGDNNEADALILAAMGADHLGAPMAAMPEKHRAALVGVTWPELSCAA